jgi:tryptophan synthase alpha chain
MNETSRLDKTFARLGERTAFVAYLMGGDPDLETSFELMAGLPGAGVDIIELGMPFTDPAADGPTIEEAGLRSLAAGTKLDNILDMVRRFRKADADTPIILMGYANPVHHRGYAQFAQDMAEAGADGAILVDLPPEEDGELRAAFETHGLALIRLATPTTDAARLPRVVAGTKGFVYYVSMTGITGSSDAQASGLDARVEAVRAAAKLPVVVGFGIKTPERAAEIAAIADGVVVGSAIVAEAHANGVEAALELTWQLAEATHSV